MQKQITALALALGASVYYVFRYLAHQAKRPSPAKNIYASDSRTSATNGAGEYRLTILP